jgi:glycolate oxidase iron-sulfur subunit
MQTSLADFIRDTPEGKEADAILRRCVHCGFCTATCPTYQLLGDELDGPRGRIYLIKQVLEGESVTQSTQLHLDRCLTCRACETTCPSGVEYGRLADIGRAVVADRVQRPFAERAKRRLLAFALPRTGLFRLGLAVGMTLRRIARPLLPQALADKLPRSVPAAGAWPAPRHARRMLVLAGCVQPALAPDTNAAAARVLDRIGISLITAPAAGCCGAVRFHLDFQSDGLDDMRRLIDAWWPQVASGEIEAIVMTASGCGATVKEYGRHLAHDPAYADKAARISAITRDLSEVLAAEQAALSALLRQQAGKHVEGQGSAPAPAAERVAFHPPCTLQHGQKLRGIIEALLRDAGLQLTPVPDAHLCCGSAGTYSILQPELSSQLRSNKLAALQSGEPQRILTANIGCQSHLAGASGVPVEHWITVVDERLGRG